MKGPLSNKPKITQDALSRGYVMRYFLKHISLKTVVEVDRRQYDMFSRNVMYTGAEVKWMIGGLANDTVSSNGTIIHGTKHKNTVTTDFYDKKMPGVSRILRNPLEFFVGIQNTPVTNVP